MKNLILVRHGKSSWDYNVGDRDRPLLEKGINDVHLVASKFSNQDIVIERVFSSPANRALHTCMIFLRTLKFPFSKFQVENTLYDFSGDGVSSFVKNLPQDINNVMIFGHNNAFTNLVNTWGDQYIENVTTSGLVHLSFKVDSWSDISKGSIRQVLFPKQLR
ncbi:phosphohistidine phosphatase [Saonia flava]|uniref:Phosphohistidine phosphatase n=1 Tax=Saonia flava TaxID=523696 RepID=A0A846QQR5_9FLAO|nr:histidine phosphatase family protein [Saonia flava]NJB70448.1 phosphohistidine phosphatase [Saonia flava]